jgi:hypothetical protein
MEDSVWALLLSDHSNEECDTDKRLTYAALRIAWNPESAATKTLVAPRHIYKSIT